MAIGLTFDSSVGGADHRAAVVFIVSYFEAGSSSLVSGAYVPAEKFSVVIMLEVISSVDVPAAVNSAGGAGYTECHNLVSSEVWCCTSVGDSGCTS